MRDILTGLAIIVIVVLTTLLVAPYFVDWNGQRTFLEAQLSRALGQTVTIGGSIDLKLLPTPYIRLNQAVVGGDEGAVRVGIRHLDLELAVAPLLHGEFDIVEGRLDEPTIRLTLQQDRSLPALPVPPALAANIRFERITVSDGTLAIADPASGRTFVVDHLDLSADAPSVLGPFKGSGTAGTERTRFRFSTTEAKKGRTHLHFAAGEAATHPGVDLDGELTLAATADGVRQSFEGNATLMGRLAAAGGAPLEWRLSGPLKADPAGAALSGGELRLGGDSGLAFKSDVSGTFGETTSLAATLTAAQLDVDRLSGLPEDPAKPPAPPQLPAPSRLRDLAAAAMPGVPTRLDVTVDAATWGGETLSDLSLHVEPAAAGAGRLKLSADGPGDLQLTADGTLSGAGTAFTGQTHVGAGDLPRALAWLGKVAPDIAPSRTSLPFAAIDARGAVEVDEHGAASRDAALDLDRSHLTGSLRLAFGDATRPPRLAADLATDRLDLDTLPRLQGMSGSAGLALDLKVAAGAVHVAGFGGGPLDAGRLALDLVGTGDGRLDLRRLRVENLGGATLAASGKLDAGTTTFDARIDADRLEAAAGLLRQAAANTNATIWADTLASRAPVLAPAHLAIAATLDTHDGAARSPRRLKLDGTLAGTALHATLAPGEGDAESLSVTADAPEGLGLLRQLGLATSPVAAPTGKGHVALTASGEAQAPWATKLDADVAGVRVTVDGRFDLFAKAHGGSGTAALRSADVGPLLRGLGFLSPDAVPPLPAEFTGALAAGGNGVGIGDIKGGAAGSAIAGTLKIVTPAGDDPVVTGALDLDRIALGPLLELVLGPARPAAKGAAWSGEAFAAAPPALPRAEVTLRGRALDLGQGLAATDASLDLRTGPALVAITRGEAKFGGGQLDGRFSLRRDGGQATLEGALAASGVRLDRPALAATLSGQLDLAGGGTTPLGLVGSLAGSGTATLADARVPGADPQALPKVFALVEDDALAVDEEAVIRAFDEAAPGPLVAGTRHGALALAGGALTFTPEGVEPAGAPVTSEIGATFDLRARRLAVRTTETLRALPKDWAGPPPSVVVSQDGPLDAPRRSFDVANFLNAVAARAIARESARVEAYEFDIRERSLFNTRVQTDRRREQDRLKAEADAKAAAEAARRAAAELARKAEAERRAKAEAARLEKQRADDAAGAATAPGGAPQPGPQQFQAPPPGATSDPTAAGRY